MTPLYLDHAATTPCNRGVLETVQRVMATAFGNPSSIHSAGREARSILEGARADVAGALGCSTHELVFTSGGSESNNLALRGAAHAARRDSRRHIVVSPIEHDSVLRACAALEREGFSVTVLDVDRNGLGSPEALVKALQPDTALVSIMHGNNEIGTIQPIAELVRAVKGHDPGIRFHTDAVQTLGQIPVDVGALGVDLLSFTAHKIYGPKGIGGLYIREGTAIEAQIAGGGQERGFRSGTESAALAAGMAMAVRLATEQLEERAAHWMRVRDEMSGALLQSVPDSRLNGPPDNRLPNNLNLSFLGVIGEDIVLRLDQRGVMASTGSACAAGERGVSHVLKAIGLPRAWAIGSLRLTFGEGCRQIDPLVVIGQVRRVIEELRSASYRPRRALRAVCV